MRGEFIYQYLSNEGNVYEQVVISKKNAKSIGKDISEILTKQCEPITLKKFLTFRGRNEIAN
ncbi:13199_t:CDS:2 [Funneliformis mosseae]|uniref:13199_t:CDS:1 n=1 Tax=Funneliformis mosseae TaxID=27381 RepID=A0A9N9BTM6_FUNMO|nr:13199_t:CDS:2 [Funneliformis mosseae]